MGILLTAFITTLTFAQWMGGGMGQGMMRGGGMCRMMDVTPQPIDPASLPEPESSGAQILKSKCTQCHGLVSPRQHASQEWYIVERMDRRMQMMARGGMGMMRRADIQPLSQEERNTLIGYLQQNAFKAMRGSGLPESGEPGGQAFAQTCSQCHALPDPSGYTSAGWKNIVEGMAGNMENMGFEPLAPEQKNAILGYLTKYARGE